MIRSAISLVRSAPRIVVGAVQIAESTLRGAVAEVMRLLPGEETVKTPRSPTHAANGSAAAAPSLAEPLTADAPRPDPGAPPRAPRPDATAPSPPGPRPAAPVPPPAPRPDAAAPSPPPPPHDAPVSPPAPQPTAPVPPAAPEPDATASPSGAPGSGEAHVSEEPELVAESADPGATDGAGAALHVSEPWPGYATQRAVDVIERLSSEEVNVLAVAMLFEQLNRKRSGVLKALRRELARREPAAGGERP